MAQEFVEDPAQQRRRAFDAERRQDARDGQDLMEARDLEAGIELPEIGDGIELAVEGQPVQQRRRAEIGVHCLGKIDLGRLHRIGPQQHPALVRRSAADPELLSRQVADIRDLGARWHHDAADRQGMGDEGGVAPLPALMGNPEPVGDDQVDAAGEERQTGRILVGKAQRGQAEAVAFVELVAPDDIQLPIDAAEGEDADAHLRQIGEGRTGASQGKPNADREGKEDAPPPAARLRAGAGPAHPVRECHSPSGSPRSCRDCP